jgi:hypothetical protein
MPTKKQLGDAESSPVTSKTRTKAARTPRATQDTQAVKTPSVKRTVRSRKSESSETPHETNAGDFVTPIKSRDPLSHEQIAVRAYYIAEQWRAEGREVTDESIWLEAERQMRAEYGWNA